MKICSLRWRGRDPSKRSGRRIHRITCMNIVNIVSNLAHKFKTVISSIMGTPMQPITNPFLQANAELLHEKEIMTRHAHKLYIVGLCKSENNYDPSDYSSVYNFCKQYHIEFDIQPLTPGIEEDSEYVTRLPAYHVYCNENYECTFHNEDSISATLISLFIKPKAKKTNWISYFWFTPGTHRTKVSVLSSSEASYRQ